MAKISVIIPVYNVERYLNRCVDSVLSQTFKDFDLILIDDGSTDDSGKICRTYEQTDNRVIYLYRENGGAAAARNTGLDWISNNSDSEWIAFIDSDDWVHPRYLELLYMAALEGDAKISQCGVWDTDAKGKEPALKGNPCIILSPEEVNSMKGVVAPTRKLYAKECLKEVRYPEGRLFEDEFVTYKILFSEKHIAYIDEPIYYYFIREGSLMHSKWTPKYLDALDAYKEQIDYFEKNNFVNSQKRSVLNMTNNIIIQFHKASAYRNKERKIILKREVQKLIRKYGKKGLGWISFEKNQGAYEVLYPRLMWIYWVCKSKISKLINKRG